MCDTARRVRTQAPQKLNNVFLKALLSKQGRAVSAKQSGRVPGAAQIIPEGFAGRKRNRPIHWDYPWDSAIGHANKHLQQPYATVCMTKNSNPKGPYAGLDGKHTF